MAPYVPSDHPQPSGWKSGGKSLEPHEQDYCTYGPPPPNYEAIRKLKYNGSYYIRYTENSSANPQPSRDYHPLSPTSLNAQPQPIIRNEYTLPEVECRGVFGVPITWKANPAVKWRHRRTWQEVLAAALASHGVGNKAGNGPVTKEDVAATYNSLKSSDKFSALLNQNSTLFHPADRDSMVFDDEPAMAMVAREYKFSLAVVCPYVEADGKGYSGIWGTEDRPPIYVRWSVGPQGLLSPLLVGCLPRQTHTKRKSFEAFWFFFEVTGNHPDWYTNMFTLISLKDLATQLGFTVTQLEPRVFMWSLVSLQRRRVLGWQIPDDHLACWIWQFGAYLMANKKPQQNPNAAGFNYDTGKLAEYKVEHPQGRLSFTKLTQLILNRRLRVEGTWIGDYARPWDEAIQAQVQYQHDKTDANWHAFQQKMKPIHKLPF